MTDVLKTCIVKEIQLIVGQVSQHKWRQPYHANMKVSPLFLNSFNAHTFLDLEQSKHSEAF